MAITDPSGDWARAREITDSGAVVVRPDHHVCWREAGRPSDPQAELMRVMSAILAR